jgi:hypothetical protein
VSTPLPVLAGTYLARVHGEWEGLPSTNTFCITRDGVPLDDPGDAANALNVATSIQQNWVAFAFAAFPTQYEAAFTTCYALGSPLVPQQVYALPAPGTRTGNPTASSTSALIAHQVDRRGRGSQSRSFLSPVSVDDISTDGKSLTDPFHTNLHSVFDTFKSSTLSELQLRPPGSNWHYVQLSNPRPRVGFPPPVPRTFPILGSTVELPLSTQRRRTRRNGG